MSLAADDHTRSGWWVEDRLVPGPDRADRPDPFISNATVKPPAAMHGFLFADLRGYTAFVDALGDRAAAALLDRYRALVRAEVDAVSGSEVKTEGDSFYVVFDSASVAIRCGLAILAAAAAASEDGHAIAVGIGVHAGETVATTDGYVGLAVNVAARLCGQAKAGELIVSDTVRALSRSSLDVSFEPLGRRRLKGLDEPVAIYRVVDATRRAHPRRPLERSLRSTVMGAGVAILLPIVGILAVTLAPRAGMAPPVTPSQDPPASATGTGGIASPVVPTEGALNDAEQALLIQAPTDFQPFCRRSIPSDGSLGGDVASLRCDLTPVLGTDPVFAADAVWFDEFSSLGRLAGAVEKVAIREGLRPDRECGTDDGPAIGRWVFGSTFTGTLACYAKDGGAWILWSYDGPQIAARAVRRDGDTTRLFAWWDRVRGYLHLL
jgi:class 3 adenylate cyclase